MELKNIIGKSFNSIEGLRGILEEVGIVADVYSLYGCKWDYRVDDVHIRVQFNEDDTQRIIEVKEL